MKLTPARLAISAAVLIVAGFGVAHFLADFATYPLGEWRMDLDDLLSNVGLFLTGLAAFLAVFRKAHRAEQRATEVEVQLNGGLQQRLAQDEQTTGEIDIRLEALEVERNQCREELAAIRATLRQMGGS